MLKFLRRIHGFHDSYLGRSDRGDEQKKDFGFQILVFSITIRKNRYWILIGLEDKVTARIQKPGRCITVMEKKSHFH